MKTYKIDPLGKNRPLMLVRGTRLPESFPDSVAEHIAKSLKANCRGVFATINGEISSSTVSPGVVLSKEANEDNNTLVVMTEGMQNESVDWEDSTGKQFRLEHEGQFVGSQYGGNDPYYTGAHKDLRTFVTGAVPYTGQPLVAANAKQWYSYTTPEGVALTFRGCIQAPIKEGTDFVGLKIDRISYVRGSEPATNFDLTLDCDSAVSLGLRNGMNDDSKPFNMRTGIGWLQIVATDDFKSHLQSFPESAGNGDAEIDPYGAYDGFTYNVNIKAINTGGWTGAGNYASFRIYVKSGSALEDSIVANTSGYAWESLGADMSGSGDTFPMVEEVSTTVNAEPTVINLTTDNWKQIVVVRFSSVQEGEKLHLELSDTVTAPGVIKFCSMNANLLHTELLGTDKKSFVIDIPRGDNVFAFFGVNYNAAGTVTISRTAATLTTVQDKVKYDLEGTGLLNKLADNFEVVTLTGEDQIVEGSVRDDAKKISKVFVVPAGEGGFRTNVTCWSSQLNKKADGTYNTDLIFNYPINVNNSNSGSEFNKVSDTDVYLVPLGFTARFELVARTAEQMRTDEELVNAATTPQVSADQVLANVLAACGTDLRTVNAKTAFEHKITGFDVSNSGDYIYVNAADVKNMYLNGNAWFEIISKTGDQYRHELLSEEVSDGTTTVETILRNSGILVEDTSIFIAKRYGDTCALLVAPKPTPGFYSANGQLIKAMTKEEVETNYNWDNCPSATTQAIRNATEFVWPEGVTSIGMAAFNGCTRLTSVTIPNTVASIGNSAFRNCNALTSADIPNTVTTIGGEAFRGTKLTRVEIPQGVTSIGNNAFSDCSGLTSVTIPSTVTEIRGYAFANCTALNPLTVPNTVTTIGNDAFKNVPKVIYGGTATGSPWGALEVVAPARTPGFYSADGQLIKAMTKDEVEHGYGYDNYPAKVNEAVKTATNFVWPDGVTRVGASVFSDCAGLTEVTIPSTVTSVGESSFKGCTGLTTVAIPEGVTSIGMAAFSGCTALATAPIPNTVTTIGGEAFRGTKLTRVEIPQGVTVIDYNTFNGCTDLTSVTIPSTVTEIRGYAFVNCTALNPLTVPNTVTTIGNDAFLNVPKVIYGGSATGSPWGAVEVSAS